jgi:hypothetical protein
MSESKTSKRRLSAIEKQRKALELRQVDEPPRLPRKGHHARRLGYTVDIVERWIPQAGPARRRRKGQTQGELFDLSGMME